MRDHAARCDVVVVAPVLLEVVKHHHFPGCRYEGNQQALWGLSRGLRCQVSVVGLASKLMR